MERQSIKKIINENKKAAISFNCWDTCISIFQYIKLRLTPGLISAFIEWQLQQPCYCCMSLLQKIFKLPKKVLILLICGILFASDVAVWNIAIQESKALPGFTAY
jgi:hypothetical protein